MSFAVAILGLAFLVLIHEAGHFFVARVVGMNPRKFYVGFPPAVVKRKRGDVEYGIGAIPLGGYVKIPGMHRPAARDAEIWFGAACEEEPDLLVPVQALRQALEREDYAGARRSIAELDLQLAERELSVVARKSARKGVEEIRDAVSTDAYWRSGTWRRLAVIFAGPAANVIAAAFLFAGFYATNGGPPTTRIGAIETGRPAEQAGFEVGDEIVAISGRPVVATTISDAVNASGGKPFTVTLHKTDGGRVTVTVRAEKREGRYRIGFGLAASGESIPTATWHGIEETGILTKRIVGSLAGLVTGHSEGEALGTVGIVQVSSSAVDQGIGYYLGVLGLISLSLALFNLLPLLPLDGGHILFSLIEGIRRKPVPREVYERVSAVGIVLFLFVFMVTLTNDIGRL